MYCREKKADLKEKKKAIEKETEEKEGRKVGRKRTEGGLKMLCKEKHLHIFSITHMRDKYDVYSFPHCPPSPASSITEERNQIRVRRHRATESNYVRIVLCFVQIFSPQMCLLNQKCHFELNFQVTDDGWKCAQS